MTMDLSTVSTRELCDELVKREGIKEYKIKNPGDLVEISYYGHGAARILVVTD